MAASNFVHYRPIARSSSLPTVFPDIDYELEDEETDTDDEDSCTEDTDGSTPVEDVFRSPLPSPLPSFGSVTSPTTYNQPLVDPYTDGAGPLDCTEPLILQLTDSGNFKIRKDPAPPVSTNDCRYASCLDFNEFNKKVQTKQEVRRNPWSHKKPNFHKVKSPQKLLNLMGANPQANILELDKNGDTPLHVYIGETRKYRVELLITLLSSVRQVNVNAKNISGFTPLHIAAMRNDIQCTIVLLVFGADPKIEDSFKLTPYDRAPDHQGNRVRELLEKYTVDPGFIHKSPPPAIHSPYSQDMIGYHLSCGLEAHFAMEIENDVLNLMRQREIEDPSEASACFMQLNHLLRWKTTKGSCVRPGSRVLYLDGGGVRGLVLIEILIEIEKRTKLKITELFDWIVGTSTGAIVALGLVHGGLTLSQIRGLFFQLSDRVFKEGLMGKWFQSVANSREMNYLLQSLFQGKMMNEVTEPKVIITAINSRDSSFPLEFFNNYDNARSNILVWEVARMASAAPMYFTDYNGYIDGGIQANNPCEQGLNEISEYYERNHMTLPHFPIMVSIGTGIFPSQELKDNKMFLATAFDGFSAIKNLFNSLLAAIGKSEEAAMSFKKRCQSMNPQVPFFRFNPSFNRYIKPNETDRKLLVDMLLSTKSYIMNRESFNELFSIVKIFDELKSIS